MKTIKCLECANDVELEDKEYRVGDIIECSFCGTELEVSSINKYGNLTVDIIEEEK